MNDSRSLIHECSEAVDFVAGVMERPDVYTKVKLRKFMGFLSGVLLTSRLVANLATEEYGLPVLLNSALIITTG